MTVTRILEPAKNIRHVRTSVQPLIDMQGMLGRQLAPVTAMSKSLAASILLPPIIDKVGASIGSQMFTSALPASKIIGDSMRLKNPITSGMFDSFALTAGAPASQLFRIGEGMKSQFDVGILRSVGGLQPSQLWDSFSSIQRVLANDAAFDAAVAAVVRHDSYRGLDDLSHIGPAVREPSLEAVPVVETALRPAALELQLSVGAEDDERVPDIGEFVALIRQVKGHRVSPVGILSAFSYGFVVVFVHWVVDAPLALAAVEALGFGAPIYFFCSNQAKVRREQRSGD